MARQIAAQVERLAAGASGQPVRPSCAASAGATVPRRESIAHAVVLVVDRAQHHHLSLDRRGARSKRRTRGYEIETRPARYHEVHEVTLAEDPFSCAQQLFLETGELREAESESGIVADRADITQVICHPLQFQLNRPQPGARAGTYAATIPSSAWQ